MITFVTVPLTSQEEAPCNNKLSLGKISSLPENLKEKESYAVLDQVRTLNSSRFRKLKQNDDIIDAFLTHEQLRDLLQAIFDDFLSDIPIEIRKNIGNNLLK